MTDIKTKRFQFLHELYKESEQDELKSCNAYKIGVTLGFDENTTDKIIRYFINEYLITKKPAKPNQLRGTITITHSGICHVEKVFKERIQLIANLTKQFSKKQKSSTEICNSPYIKAGGSNTAGEDIIVGNTKSNNNNLKADSVKSIENNVKPWYKKTWIIIVGFVTILTGLSALVYLCESETGKHFINSFKRKPSISVDYRRTKLYARTKKRVDDFYESIRNEKIDPWLFINAGVKVQVTKHNGDVINYSGILFTGAPRLVFWSDDFIPPFIEDAIIEVFDQTIDECRRNSLDPEIYVYEAKRILSDFIYKIYNRMADMDQKLMKQAHSENFGHRDVSREIEKMCKRLDEHYNAAILLASGKNPNPHLPPFN